MMLNQISKIKTDSITGTKLVCDRGENIQKESEVLRLKKGRNLWIYDDSSKFISIELWAKDKCWRGDRIELRAADAQNPFNTGDIL